MIQELKVVQLYNPYMVDKVLPTESPYFSGTFLGLFRTTSQSLILRELFGFGLSRSLFVKNLLYLL